MVILAAGRCGADEMKKVDTERIQELLCDHKITNAGNRIISSPHSCISMEKIVAI